MSPIKTKYVENVLEKDEAMALYLNIRDNIQWKEGIRSRHGFTRLAYGIDPCDLPQIYPELYNVILDVSTKLGLMTEDTPLLLGFVYLNYYRNGNDYTPQHSHKNTKQLIISLGETRNLTVAKKTYSMTNGSAIVFGSSIHGVPKDDRINEGRISIAVFILGQ